MQEQDPRHALMAGEHPLQGILPQRVYRVPRRHVQVTTAMMQEQVVKTDAASPRRNVPNQRQMMKKHEPPANGRQ